MLWNCNHGMFQIPLLKLNVLISFYRNVSESHLINPHIGGVVRLCVDFEADLRRS